MKRKFHLLDSPDSILSLFEIKETSGNSRKYYFSPLLGFLSTSPEEVERKIEDWLEEEIPDHSMSWVSSVQDKAQKILNSEDALEQISLLLVEREQICTEINALYRVVEKLKEKA